MIILYHGLADQTNGLLEKDEIDNMNQHIFWVTD